METVDIEAKTIDEAIEKACRQFQATRDKLKIEIIAEGNPGFLGFGAKKARIRAGLLEIDRELDNLLNTAGVFAPAELPIKASGFIPPEAPLLASTRKKPEYRSADNVPRKLPENERPSKSHGHDGNGKQGHAQIKKADNEEKQSLTLTSADPPEALKALELVEGILTRMHIPAQVRLQEVSDAVVLKITGDGDGLLIGKKGQNLDAIQYIVNKAVHHSINDSRRIVIDTEEYRKRREESLQDTALKIARKVQKTRKPVTLGPMNPHDRRIIHMALKNEKSLYTKSRGEGEFRKIVITPSRHNASEETP